MRHQISQTADLQSCLQNSSKITLKHRCLQLYNAENKGWSTVNYHQSPAFDCPYLSCNDHCEWWLFQKIFFYYCHICFLEILVNNLELVLLEFKQIYKTQILSLFSFYLLIFYSLFSNHLCVLTFSTFSYFSTGCKHAG